MSFNTSLADNLAEHILGNITWTMPTNIYVSLHTADPGGNGASEESGGWYARQIATSSFAAATTSGATTNANITWALTTTSDTTITHWGIWDAVTSGNFLVGGAFGSSVTLNAGVDTAQINSGNLTVTISGAANNLSDYLYPRILDHILGQTAFTSPAQPYLSLYTSNPTGADTGNEVSGNGYARQAGTWSNLISAPVDLVTTINFPAPTGNWGTVTHFGIHDASTAGNLLMYGAITTSSAVGEGAKVSLAAGAGDISFAG